MKVPTDYTGANATIAANPPNFPDGDFKDESSDGADDGTIMDANIFNDVYYALINVVNEWGSFTSPAAIENANGVQDFLDALVAGMKTVANPFINFAEFRYELTAGTDGQTISSTGFTDLLLNTTVLNNIATASLDTGTGVMTIPAGTYRVEAWGTFYDSTSNNNNRLVVYDVTGASDVALGQSFGGTTDDDYMNLFLSDTFTLAASGDIKLRIYTNIAGVAGREVTDTNSNNEVYQSIKLWKIT